MYQRWCSAQSSNFDRSYRCVFGVVSATVGAEACCIHQDPPEIRLEIDAVDTKQPPEVSLARGQALRFPQLNGTTRSKSRLPSDGACPQFTASCTARVSSPCLYVIATRGRGEAPRAYLPARRYLPVKLKRALGYRV